MRKGLCKKCASVPEMRDTEFMNDKGKKITQKLVNRSTGIIEGAYQGG
jgi:hypothetical protein